MKKRHLCFAVVLIGWLFVGCVGPRQAPEDLAVGPDDAVTYLLPTDQEFFEVKNGHLATLTLSPHLIPNSQPVPGPESLFSVKRYDDNLSGTLVDGWLTLRWVRRIVHFNDSWNPGSEGSMRCGIEQLVQQQPGAVIVKLQPGRCSPSRNNSLNFTRADLLQVLSGVVFHYKIELDSNYKPGSIKANFKRSLKRNYADQQQEKDQITGLIYDTRLDVPSLGKSVSLNVAIDPYRDGSRVVANLRLERLWPASSRIDLRPLIAEIRAELKKIVES